MGQASCSEMLGASPGAPGSPGAPWGLEEARGASSVAPCLGRLVCQTPDHIGQLRKQNQGPWPAARVFKGPGRRCARGHPAWDMAGEEPANPRPRRPGLTLSSGPSTGVSAYKLQPVYFSGANSVPKSTGIGGPWREDILPSPSSHPGPWPCPVNLVIAPRGPSPVL